MGDPDLDVATRVRLRRLRPEDLARFQAYRGDLELGRFQGWRPLPDAQARAFIDEMAQVPFGAPGRWLQLAIADTGDDGLIGDIGLHLQAPGDATLREPSDAVLELGFTLARAAHGRGLAQEAVALAIAMVWQQTAAARIVAISDTRNGPCMRLLKRLGFSRTVTLEADFRGERCQERHFVLHRPGLPAATLRPARPGDGHAVAELLIHTRLQQMPYAPSAHSDGELHAWVEATLLPAGGVTVAERAGRIVGVLSLSHDAEAYWIDQLFVHPAHIGSGLGRELLRHALAVQGRPLRLWTFQANLHGRAFYEHHGFEAILTTDGSANEELCPDVLYERLAP